MQIEPNRWATEIGWVAGEYGLPIPTVTLVFYDEEGDEFRLSVTAVDAHQLGARLVWDARTAQATGADPRLN